MAKNIKTDLSTLVLQGIHPEPVEIYCDKDPGVDVGDRVSLTSRDGDTFIAEVADIEETRGKIYLDLK